MKGKNNQVKLLKKYSNFLILIYCHYIINIFNSLIDITDIQYSLLINLFNNFITNIFLKCINTDLDLNNTKTILNEGCSIILDYIIISKEEKFNNNNYTPKFTDAIQFSYQKILHKIENSYLDSKLKNKYNIKTKSPNLKKRSNKQSLGNKTSLQQLINKQNQSKIHNIQKNNNISLQNTTKFKNNLHKCIELLNCIFINIVKSLFIKKCNNLQIFTPLDIFLDNINQNNNLINDVNDINYINDKNDSTTLFFNKLSFNIDKIENYMLIMSNDIVLLFKSNKNINLYELINIIKLGYHKINELQNLNDYSHLFFDIIYIIYPYLLIKNYNTNICNLLELNITILNWCLNNNNWLISLFKSNQDNDFISNIVLKKINQHFLQSKTYV
tara:strand:+ start:936 stop:2093 length:1158 start_codon:yes stop_codon:yes gene_type:complete